MPLDDLTGLLQRWQATGGRLDRARIAAEGASLLRGLSEGERRDLGRALAQQGVQVASDRGAQHLPGGDPEAVRATVEDLLDLDVDETLGVVARLTTDVPAAPPPPPGPEGQAAPEVSTGRRDERAARRAEARAREAQARELAEREAEEQRAARRRAEQEQTAARRAAARDAAAARATAAELEAAERNAMPRAEATIARLTADVDAAGHALARLRRVEDLARDAGDPLQVLQAVPAGWERRRAATRLLASGALDDVDAPALLGLFDRRGDRERLAGALLGAGRLDPDDLDALLPAATARRLAQRAGRERAAWRD